MAGPVASVLLNDFNSPHLIEILASVGDVVEGLTDGIEIDIKDTRSIGGDYVDQGRPFLVSTEPSAVDELQREVMRTAFGTEPGFEILLMVMCNSREDHRILGTLAHYLAIVFRGNVSFQGALLPRNLAQPPVRRSWIEIQLAWRSWVQSYPGTIVALPYVTESGRDWAVHVADPEFLANWLRSPEFHMIK